MLEDVTQYIGQTYFNDAARELVSNGLLVKDNIGIDFGIKLIETYLLFVGGGMLLVIFEAIFLAFHWVLLPFTWFPILIYTLFKCDSNYIETVFFFTITL